MQVEKGPMLGECERCRRRSQSKVPEDCCFCFRRKVSLRTRCAVDSSNPDDIHWRDLQGWSRQRSRFKSQRHSTILHTRGKTPMRRKGFVVASDHSLSPAATDSRAVNEPRAATILPRLSALILTRVGTEYQLIRARVTPVSLSAIQVPPPNSEG